MTRYDFAQALARTFRAPLRLRSNAGRTISAIAVIALIAAAPLRAEGRKWRAPEIALDLTFAATGVADTLTSIHGIRSHGLIETNRLFRSAFENGHYTVIWTAQAAGTAAIVLLCHSLITEKSRTTRTIGYALLITVTAARAWVVIHNARLNARTGP